MVAIAIVLVLLVVIILLLPFLLDLNRFRDHYVPIIEQVLHRKVAVQDVRLTLYPTLGVQLREVIIADDPAFSSHPFLTVPSVQVAVQWRPLLQRRLEVKRVSVESPIIQVIRSPKGVLNIATIGKVSSSGKTLPENTESKDPVSSLVGVLAVKQFSLTGGTLKFEDRTRQSSKALQIKNLTFNTESVAIGEIALVRVHGMVMPYQIPFDVTGRFGPLQANLDIPNFDIDGLVGKVAVTANGEMIDGQLTGDIQIPKASTDDLPIKLGMKAPIALSQLQAHFEASIFPKGQQTRSGEVLIDPIRLKIHMGRSTIHLSGKGTPTRFSLVGDSPTFYSQDLPVSLPIQQPFVLEHIQFEAEKLEKNLILQSFTAKAFDGTMRAKGVLDTWIPPLTFSMQGAFKKFSAETLMKAITPSPVKLTGVGELKWTTRGIVPSSASPAFDGPIHLTIRDGAVIGFDLVKSVEDALRIPGVLGKSTGRTQYSLIDAKTELNDEGLAIRKFIAHAPNFSLRSVGKVGLDQSLNLQGTLTVPPTIAEKITQQFPMALAVRREGQLLLPFVVQGTIQNPRLRLNSQLLGQQVKKKVEERLEKVLQGDDQELQKLLDDGKDLLKQFFRK